MSELAWRKQRLEEVLTRPDLAARVRAGFASGPLCDHCLGRLVAEVGSGMTNDERGRIVRSVLGVAPPAEPCGLCGGLFDRIEEWVARATAALEGWQFDTLAVISHTDPAILMREEALWRLSGADLAEPYKQAFNRLLGTRLCQRLGCEADLRNPDVVVQADHRAGEVTVRIEPLWASGRYRKLVRGIPQCRWRPYPASVQQIVGDPVLRAAGGEDHLFHGCGREDVDVRCLAERPFVLEVMRPRRRLLDWDALAAEINRSGQVEVAGLERCRREAVARVKALRPEKTYRAMVQLGTDIADLGLARLATLVGPISQQTPTRVLRRRPDLVRTRRVVAIEWRRTAGNTVELTVRAQAGTYIKELASGDAGRTRPSVAEVLGTSAACIELDVIGIHTDPDTP
jgi:tRNA pseudouridine synthase 10